MTEQEIINILKENKKKGIGYKFLPEEVQKWIYENFYKKILVYFNYKGEWVSIGETNLMNTSDYQNHIFSLTEDFKMEENLKGKWVEFKIENFYFTVNYAGSMNRYFWTDYGKMLMESFCCGWGYTTFGGWQYANSNTWFMTPQLKIILADLITYEDISNPSHYVTPAVYDCKPAIPTKIRFWRN